MAGSMGSIIHRAGEYMLVPTNPFESEFTSQLSGMKLRLQPKLYVKTYHVPSTQPHILYNLKIYGSVHIDR